MIDFNEILEGAAVPIESPSLPKTVPTFSHPPRVSTGKAEGDKLGALLLYLATRNRRWHAVPWRMLRNTYMEFGMITRVLSIRHRKMPELPEQEPVVMYGGGRIPMEELLIGAKELIERKLATHEQWDDQSFLVPTKDLVSKLVPPS
jgi:hypothetical protein